MKNENEKLTGIPHKGKEITFQYPVFRGDYEYVAGQIDEAGLQKPNSLETASLIYDAFQNPKGEDEEEIIFRLTTNWFWEFTGNLYLPKDKGDFQNGIILDLDPQNIKFENGRLVMDKSSLTKRLQENDESVKFVPFGYKMGEQSISELTKNPYILARYGEEGTEKIAEIASKYNKNPYLEGYSFAEEEKVRISVLGHGWGTHGGLCVGSGCDCTLTANALGVCSS